MTKILVSQHDRHVSDRATHPLDGTYTGTYKGVAWKIKWNVSWCGYWFNLTGDQINQIEDQVHGGITCGYVYDHKYVSSKIYDCIGFDTCHWQDYQVWDHNILPSDIIESLNPPNRTYKDFDYVFNHIKEIIDQVI